MGCVIFTDSIDFLGYDLRYIGEVCSFYMCVNV